MKETFTYLLIVTDHAGQTEISTAKSMVFALSYSDKLWKSAVINNSAEEGSIEDKFLGISLTVQKAAASEKSVGNAAFLITVNCSDFEKADSFRKALLLHIKNNLRFSNISVLRDDISSKISRNIYLKVTEVEDLLRSFLAGFFTRQRGLDWWKSTASKEMIEKVNLRRDKDGEFAELFDPEFILTDIRDLGELATSALPTEAFRTKWEQLVNIKNKVLYNNLFVVEDYNHTEVLAREISLQIEKAESRNDPFRIGSSLKKLSTNNPFEYSLETNESWQFPSVTQAVNPAASSVPAKEVSGKSEESKAHLVEAPVPAQVSMAAVIPVIEEKKEQESKPQVVVETPKVDVPVAVAAPVQETKKDEVKEPVVAEAQKKDAVPAERPVRSFEMITEKELLSELKTYEMNTRGFVDLKVFATQVLGPKGFAPGSVYSLSRSMNDKGMVKIYDVKDEKGFMIKAIKTA